MDEPFSALDVLTAETLRGELLELWIGHKIPTRAIFIVTHNIEEAVVLADRIIVPWAATSAHIHADFAVNLPQPRNRKDPQFIEFVDAIYRVLTSPDTKEDVIHTAPGTSTPVQHHALMLPHTRPGGMAGLLEIVADHGDRVDLHHLSWRVELPRKSNALLPTVDTAVLPGSLLRLEEGDAIASPPKARPSPKENIQTRKAMFRKAALASGADPPSRWSNPSKQNPDRTLPDEFFHDLIDEHFSEDESRRQLETAIQWGSLCGNLRLRRAATGKLTLTEA